MRKPHKHAALIKAWADGAEIEMRDYHVAGRWIGMLTPKWDPCAEYRIKPHRWQKEIDAFKAGKPVEYRYLLDVGPARWQKALSEPTDAPAFEYRIKPEIFRYRLALWTPGPGLSGPRPPVVIFVPEREQQHEDREKWGGFVRWLTDWQEVEVPQ